MTLTFRRERTPLPPVPDPGSAMEVPDTQALCGGGGDRSSSILRSGSKTFKDSSQRRHERSHPWHGARQDQTILALDGGFHILGV
jgi:hypothetical protein